MSVESGLFFGRERSAQVRCLDERGVKSYAAQLGEHSCSFETPWGGQAVLADQMVHIACDAHRSAECLGTRRPQKIGEDLDAAHQGVFEELLLRRNQAVLSQPTCDRRLQNLLLAGLG